MTSLCPQCGRDAPVGLSDLPALLGVGKMTPYQWRARGQLPEPDGWIGQSPWWWRSRIMAWHEERKGG